MPLTGSAVKYSGNLSDVGGSCIYFENSSYSARYSTVFISELPVVRLHCFRDATLLSVLKYLSNCYNVQFRIPDVYLPVKVTFSIGVNDGLEDALFYIGNVCHLSYLLNRDQVLFYPE